MVFISYSHEDESFVDHLSSRLIGQDIKVWRDEYKLLPGDSLTARIRSAIDQSSLLCVVISNAAFASQWVSREIEAGLLHESQAVGFSIVPLLREDVEIPEVLRDRLWVDFRADFETGASRLLVAIRSISRVDRDKTGTVMDDKYFLYYATEEGWVGGLYDLVLDIVSFDREEKFCILTSFQFRGNKAATKNGLRDRSIPSVRVYLLQACAEQFSVNPARVEIRADKPARGTFYIEPEDDELKFEVRFQAKMLGSHRGETTVFNIGALFGQVCAGARIVSAGEADPVKLDKNCSSSWPGHHETDLILAFDTRTT